MLDNFWEVAGYMGTNIRLESECYDSIYKLSNRKGGISMGNPVITLRDLMPVAHPEKTKVKFNMNAGDVNLRAYDLLLKDTSTTERTDSGSRWYEMNAWRSATGQANNNLNHAEYLLSFAQYYTYGPEYFIFGGMHKVEKAVPRCWAAWATS